MELVTQQTGDGKMCRDTKKSEMITTVGKCLWQRCACYTDAVEMTAKEAGRRQSPRKDF